jgi:MoaA/NifB/PqqE/SkfB family radical SAM enzyme/glycosyltransferase involved in cell wall biosynthesis
MRVVIVTRSDLFPPYHGAAAKIVHGAEGMAAHGAQVSVVTDDRDSYWRLEGGAWKRRDYPPRVRAAEEWRPLPELGRWAERLCGRIGYPPEEYFLYRPMFDPAWWLRVAAVGVLEKADVFQAEFPGYGVPAVLAAKALGRRSCLVQHNVEYDRLSEMAGLSDEALARLRAFEVGICRAVDEIIAVSVDDRERMVRDGVPAEKITVIPHGVRAAAHASADGRGIRERYGVPAGAPLLFFHGVLHYHPNTQAVRFIVAELLPRLLARHPDLRVICAGMNPPLYYSHPAVSFPGMVEDLAEHIAAADLCLCPIDSGGGTRLKLLEYYAAGKAVVSTRKGAEGLRSRHDVEVWLADGAEPFAAGVLALLADPQRAARIGRGAQRFVRRYDWNHIGRATLELYEGRGRGEDWNERLLEGIDQEPLEAGHRPPATGHRPAAPSRPEAAHLPRYDAPNPLTMLLLLNRGCNLRCAFCDLYDRPERMDVKARLPALLDQAWRIGTRVVVFTGGEPFLHKDLFSAVRMAKERGFGTNVTTNGTLVERRWRQLQASGLDSISLSLDGLEATHDALRGREGTFARTTRALERLCADGRIHTAVYFVVTRRNVHELIPVYERVASLGASFDFWPVNDAPELTLNEPDQVRAYLEAIEHIAARDPDVAARRAYMERGVDYHAGKLHRVRCLGLVDQYGIDWKGDLQPCCVWGEPSLKVGNVFDTPLDELWVAPATQAARERIAGEGCAVDCFNHSLFHYQRCTGEPFALDPLSS